MNNGLTFLELLVVIGILAVFLGLGYINFSRFKTKQDLINAADQIYSDIQWIRQKSMGSAHSYGINFFSNGYILFEDIDDNMDYDASDTVIKREDFKNLTLSGCDTVIFSRRGIANTQCTIKISNIYNVSKEISISQFKIRIK